MHHDDKNTSIKFVAEFAGEERETAPAAAPVRAAEHGGEHSSCARRSYDAPGMTPALEMMRLRPRDLGGWLAGLAQPEPETRGAGWRPRAF